MKKYLLLLAVLCAAISSKAYDVEYAGCYKSFKLEFRSVDENNDSVTLSELVTIPLEKDGTTNREVKFFVLCSTVFTPEMHLAATDSLHKDAIVLRTIATEGAICVQVDGQGYGSSEGKPLTFLVNKLTARQSIDGLFAAMDYARANGIAISSDYYTLNTGYSLDGGHAIAIQRYLEKYASEDAKARFRLKKTICGGAPINATATLKYALDKWLNGAQYSTIFDGFIQDNAQGALHAVDKTDIFNPDNTIRQDAIEGTSAAGKALWKAIIKENMDEDWMPETPITYIHLANDTIVTYENAEIALKAWGHEKFRILNKNLPDERWNVSLLHSLHDATSMILVDDGHMSGGMDFFAGVVDGCIRDTLITSTYGREMNFKDMLTTAFDIGAGFSSDIPVSISKNMHNGMLNIRSIGYCRFTAEMLDSLGQKSADIRVTVKPEVLDSLSTKLTVIDAKGYLHLPIDFDITLTEYNARIHGTCNDLYQMLENLSAIVLHRTCSTKEEAEKLCNAFNSNMVIKANVSYPLLGQTINLDTEIALWYGTKRIDKVTYYYIEPYYLTSTSKTGKKNYSKLSDLMNFIAKDVNIEEYTTIDNKSFTVSDYTVMFHVTERNYGETKLYADILNPDSTVFGRVDLVLTGVDMNDDGTRQTFKVDFTVALNNIPVKLVGTCNNLNDAILAAILCYGNRSCPTEAAAKAYADAVNQNVEMELYVAKVNDDGTYPEELSYINYGPVKATTTKDEFGAYCAQYVVNWMGKGEITLTSLINLLLK